MRTFWQGKFSDVTGVIVLVVFQLTPFILIVIISSNNWLCRSLPIYANQSSDSSEIKLVLGGRLLDTVVKNFHQSCKFPVNIGFHHNCFWKWSGVLEGLVYRLSYLRIKRYIFLSKLWKFQSQ